MSLITSGTIGNEVRVVEFPVRKMDQLIEKDCSKLSRYFEDDSDDRSEICDEIWIGFGSK